MKVAFLNPQGNFDPEDRYWTEHPDFGGQLVYVKEVAQAMANNGIQVDIITRRIVDPQWQGFEKEIDYYPGVENLRIIRISFGGARFLAKEELWPYLEDYVEGIGRFYTKSESGWPNFFTAHYADGGLSGRLLAERYGIPFSFTAHSLGAQKMDKLNYSQSNSVLLEEKYHFTQRINAERLSMSSSIVNIVSTLQERFQQYAHQLYVDQAHIEEDDRFSVIPPGVNTRIFYPVDEGEEFAEIEKKIINAQKTYLSEERWDLPWVLASSRLDPKKNHRGLFAAFAKRAELQETSNLCVILRGIEDPLDDCVTMEGVEGLVLCQLREIVEKYNLWGKVCFLDLRSQKEIADCYRYLSIKRGVFALTALYEPFGLAPLEAAACGLPVVVTMNGGPAESLIDDTQEYGVLIDPESTDSIANGLLRLLTDAEEWQKIAQAGIQRVRSRYTWEQTAKGYETVIHTSLSQKHPAICVEKIELSLSELQKLYNSEVRISNDTD